MERARRMVWECGICRCGYTSQVGAERCEALCARIQAGEPVSPEKPYPGTQWGWVIGAGLLACALGVALATALRGTL
jgi:hypothetical protein